MSSTQTPLRHHRTGHNDIDSHCVTCGQARHQSCPVGRHHSVRAPARVAPAAQQCCRARERALVGGDPGAHARVHGRDHDEPTGHHQQDDRYHPRQQNCPAAAIGRLTAASSAPSHAAPPPSNATKRTRQPTRRGPGPGWSPLPGSDRRPLRHRSRTPPVRHADPAHEPPMGHRRALRIGTRPGPHLRT